MTVVEHSEDAPEAIGEQKRQYMKHSICALANGSKERDRDDDDDRRALLDKQGCSRRSWRKVEKQTGIAHEANGVDFVLRVICRDVQGAVMGALRSKELRFGVRIVM